MLKQDSESHVWVEICKVSEENLEGGKGKLSQSLQGQTLIDYILHCYSVMDQWKTQRCLNFWFKYATALLNKLSGNFCGTQEYLTETFGSTDTIQAAAVLKKNLWIQRNREALVNGKKHCPDSLPQIHFGGKQPLSSKVFQHLVLGEDS